MTRTIPATVDDVWAGISAPGYLEAVHPFCERNPVMVWPGSAARDEIHYRSGWVYQRTFTDWIDGVGYDLDIGTAPVGPPEPNRTDLSDGSVRDPQQIMAFQRDDFVAGAGEPG